MVSQAKESLVSCFSRFLSVQIAVNANVNAINNNFFSTSYSPLATLVNEIISTFKANSECCAKQYAPIFAQNSFC